MAREQWKKIGIVSGLVTVGLSILLLAAAGGSKAMAFEKDIDGIEEATALKIKALKDNQSEDRGSIKEIAGLVKSLQEKQNEDYKELKQENHDAEVRDEKVASQYGLILTHMTQQTETAKRQDTSINSISVSIGKMETKMETLTKDNE